MENLDFVSFVVGFLFCTLSVILFSLVELITAQSLKIRGVLRNGRKANKE